MNSKFGRRDFFKLTGAVLAVSSCQRNWLTNIFETEPAKLTSLTILSGYRVGEAYEYSEAGYQINNDSNKKIVKLKSEIHSITHSKELNLKVFTSKLEPYSYCQIGDGELVELKAFTGHYFYGHSAIDEKRKRIYFTYARIPKDGGRNDMDRLQQKGYIYSYSYPDFKFVERFPTYGYDPHDMMIEDDGDTLVVCNGGAGSSVTFVDLNTQKLLKDYQLRLQHISLRHIVKVDSQNYVIAPLSRDNNRPCPPYRLNLKTGFNVFPGNYMFEMTTMRIQLLSIVLWDGHIYCSCPNTDTVIVWTPEGKLIGGVQIPSASNLVVSRKLNGVVAGSGYDGENARLLNVREGTVVFDKLPWSIRGSHSLAIES